MEQHKWFWRVCPADIDETETEAWTLDAIGSSLTLSCCTSGVDLQMAGVWSA